MSNFKYLTIITITGNDIISIPTITQSGGAPVVVGVFAVSGLKLGISDTVILVASIGMMIGSFSIFKNKDLPI